MSKSNRAKRKIKARKRKEHMRKNALRAPPFRQMSQLAFSITDTERALSPPAYHQVVISGIQDETGPMIDSAVLGVQTARLAYWSEARQFGEHAGDSAWSLLQDYLQKLEADIAQIVRTHTHYYWVHLYRRIGLGLHWALDNISDPRTLGLVRSIMEVAFVKYAAPDEQLRDIAHVSTIAIEDIAGGLFYRELVRAIQDRRVLRQVAAEFRNSNQYVMAQFSVRDYVNIYLLEALAYEYWLVTARMRRVGKGGSIVVSEDGNIYGGDAGGDDFEWLVRNYDSRTDRIPFEASALGVTFRNSVAVEDIQAIAACYNLERQVWPDVCSYDEAQEQTLIPNFYLTCVNVAAFYRAHSFAEQEFLRARGFSLTSFLGIIAAIGLIEIRKVFESSDYLSRFYRLHQLYQRGYVVRKESDYFADVIGKATALLDGWLGIDGHTLKADATAVIDSLTLTTGKHRSSGLWSLGPRYVFFHYDNAIIVDLQSLHVVLQNAFFGVRLGNGPKGPLFEEFFRSQAQESGLEVLPNRVLTSNAGKEREVDAAIRRGSSLFLCECRTMERPLDLEISRHKTLKARISDLSQKLEQGCSLATFVATERKGRNYDFSWADRIDHLVVSPFVEWVWSRDTALWLDDATPRILCFSEAISYISRQ
jgi:hypothetical protein